MRKKTFCKIISLLVLLLYQAFCAFAVTAQSMSFYWDEPKAITAVNSQFNAVVSDGQTAYCIFEEVEPFANGGSFWISMQKLAERSWSAPKRIAGPFSYIGDIPDSFSAALNKNGTLSVAVAASDNSLHVYTSADGGEHFAEALLPVQEQTIVGPRLFVTSSGAFMLFASLGAREIAVNNEQQQYERFSFSLVAAVSADGFSWPSVSPFAPSAHLSNPFSPYLCPAFGGDMVLFQAQYSDGVSSRLSNQLYSAFSADNLETWTEPVLFTDNASVSQSSEYNFFQYNNQRPFLFAQDGALYAVWERTLYTADSPNVWFAEVSPAGALQGEVSQVSLSGGAHRPMLFSYADSVYALWFDNRRGSDAVFCARRNGLFWDEYALSANEADAWARFAYPLVFGKERELAFVWQRKATREKFPRLYTLQFDKSASAPTIAAVSFTKGRRSTAQKVSARVVLPRDASGIAGFSWIWTRDKQEEPPAELSNLSDNCNISARADGDGLWYFKARVLDYAGNWSPSATLAYYRDITPPRAPSVTVPPQDAYGFLRANSFSMRWKADSQDDDVAGYSWSLEYIAPIDKALAHTERHPLTLAASAVHKSVRRLLSAYAPLQKKASLPPRRNLGAKTAASYENRLNGLYAFSVCAIDTVGNISAPTVIPLLLNKYVPETAVVTVQSAVDAFGSVDVSVLGRNFSYDGTVTAVYFDRDGEAPYDIALYAQDGAFTVESDERITGIHIDYAEAGLYKIGVLHSDRGVYFSDKTIRINEFGTVKIERPYAFSPDWEPIPYAETKSVSVTSVFLWTLCAFALFAMLSALKGLAKLAQESLIIRQEVHALLTGGIMPLEKKKQTTMLIRRRSSLKTKLVIFTMQLVLGIVLLVSLPLGYVMMQTQEKTLIKGLGERVDVLMNSIASSVRMYLPAQNDLELSALPNLGSSLAEVSTLTILGLPRDMRNTNLNYVWATNDARIAESIDTEEYVQGSSRLMQPTVASILSRFGALNEEAVFSVGELAQRINELSAEGAALALRTDAESLERRAQINDDVRVLSNQASERLDALSKNAAGSYPPFNTEALDRSNTEYLFYRPVLYRQGNEPMYVRALILMQVSTDQLIGSIDKARNTIVYIAVLIALVAVTIGTIGAFILASLIVRPIRSLVSHVEMISNTRRKEQLAGQEIIVKTRDEIGLLGETVNEMTRSLVKAALDENLLMDGKAVQQAFIPLLTDQSGNKATTADLEERAMQLFGYYEGASGVSGDYFDYKKLDERWYCIIKCDASGHGVPAALIMTVVATLYRQYFEHWTWKSHGADLHKLVTQINDFIETLGLKGKFATLMVCLFDTQSGDVYMCNAGDNIIHYYDVSEKKERTVSLAETPAAGPLPSFMVDMKGGFKVEKLHLDTGDVLFLYTDGIEESTRKFRDADFSVMKCDEGAAGAVHGNHKVGEESEQLGPDRIQAIIEAVFARRVYRLERYHNPLPSEELLFDFSDCAGSVKDAVLALASVEKVFRMYKDSQCTDMDTVRVDRNIDSFLKQHFNRYDYYCASQNDTGETNYLYYTSLKEDEQLDDLTLLAVQKN